MHVHPYINKHTYIHTHVHTSIHTHLVIHVYAHTCAHRKAVNNVCKVALICMPKLQLGIRNTTARTLQLLAMNDTMLNTNFTFSYRFIALTKNS
jgi:hypothetical protein